MQARKVRCERKTKETGISVDLNLDGTGASRVRTGIPFLDHMLTLLAKHAGMDLRLTAKGDLEVDDHHTVEDTGLVLGQALDEALGDRRGIARYGWALVPMDDALSEVAVDLGGRPYLVLQTTIRPRVVRGFDLQLVEEFLRAFCTKGRMNLHVIQRYGRDAHHVYESIFKALACALKMSCARDARLRGVPSSKGQL